MNQDVALVRTECEETLRTHCIYAAHALQQKSDTRIAAGNPVLHRDADCEAEYPEQLRYSAEPAPCF